MAQTTPSTAEKADAPRALSAIDKYFKITERGSTVWTEVRGGLVTFFAMSYIVVLNPLILTTIPDGTGEFLAGGDVTKIAAVTALVAGILSITMGIVAKFPLAIAAGLGLNAFLTFSVASLDGMSWPDAMGIIVLEGLIILVLVLTGFREAVFKAVPKELKTAIGVGIGLFIALIGLVDSGIVRPGNPVLAFGVNGSLDGWPMLVFVVGLFLTIVLYVRKVRGAILIGIVASTILAVVIEAVADLGGKTADNATGWGLVVPEMPDKVADVPDFSLIGNFSLFGSIEKLGLLAVALLVFSVMLADFFDTMGTMVAIGGEADLLDEDGNPPRTKQILIVDSIAAAAGGAASVSSNTSYIESAAGVGDGARTGLASVVTGAAFLLATLLSPLVAMVPYEAATPALVVVGFLMMMQISGIDWRNMEVAIPAFLAIVLMPFTYSITVGIGAGFVAYVILKVAVGKVRQVHPLLWVCAGLFVIYFAMTPIKELLGV
ncbi:NCS2 family permease [Actinotalea fermentans]|uniref:Permease n=1 Tax=Actinotalea fermentans TaxID=43671 RepID=A0A511YXL2_9CELL|nr:NCS2 family permease [Actinotalea fermentans]KGM16822.1 permease [Actinotalea fermentans ATCC 43279 = JCM 9966 = DSM 3133]GEN79938.1 permease [Actinotalea fermentans]